MRPDAVLVGNNLAVLVAAAQLGASGRRVVLLDDGRRPGGHFRGMRVDDHDFDLGMVLLEQAPAGLERDVTGYRPEVRNDWVRFGALVWDWIESCVSTRRAPTPECLVEGRRGPDHLIANRLDVFSAAGAPAPIPLAPADDRHASNKLTAPVYDTLTYADAARLNHGEALHERFVEPFLRKLLGVSSDALLARYHRAAWVPLYWPETLAAACQGRAELLPEYPFWTTSSGFVGELVRRLESDVAALENVTVHSSPVARIALEGATCTVTAEDGARWSTPRPALGLAPVRVNALLGCPSPQPGPAASVTLACCLVRGAAIGSPTGCLSVLDDSYVAYRVTDQDAMAGLDPEWHRVVVEAGPGAASRLSSETELEAGLVRELQQLLGIDAPEDVRALRTVTVPGALAVPTPEAVAAADVAHLALASTVPAALLTGALLGYGATSINDQVVQGLRIVEELA